MPTATQAGDGREGQERTRAIAKRAQCGRPPGLAAGVRPVQAELPANKASLAGVIDGHPSRIEGQGGELLTSFAIRFPAPGKGSGLIRVKAPDRLVDHQRLEINPGSAVFVTGQLTGAGLWAEELVARRSAGRSSNR